MSFSRRWQNFVTEQIKKIYVHGYIKPEQSFYTLTEWEGFANQILKFQKDGYYVSHGHGNVVGPEDLKKLIDDFYGFQINVDVSRYDLLTTKNVLDHIEDFSNHRLWSLEKQFGQYFYRTSLWIYRQPKSFISLHT